MSSAIDTLSPEELRQFEQMQADEVAENAAAAAAEPSPQPEAQQPQPGLPSTTAEPQPAAEAPEPAGEPGDARALHEERNRRRELQNQLAEFKAKAAADQARVEERLRMLTEATQAHFQQQQAAQAPKEEPPPDFSTDPAGFIQHGFRTQQAELQRALARIQQLEQGNQQLTQVRQQNDALSQLGSWAQAQEVEFRRAQPDYDQASGYLKEAREKMIRAMGVTDQQRINAQLAADVRSLAAMARDQGNQFPRVMYDLAVAHGYQRAPAAQAVPEAQEPGTYAAAPAAPAAAASAAERLVRGNDMATTIGSTGGAARGQPTAAAIADMSEAEFARVYQQTLQQGPAAMRAMFGV